MAKTKMTKEKTLNKKIMQRCKELRKTRTTWTVRGLAKKLGIGENHLTALESGRATPTNENQMKYFSELGIDMNHLIKSIRIANDSSNLTEQQKALHKLLLEVDSLDNIDDILLFVELAKGIRNFKRRSKNKRVRKTQSQ